MALVTVGSIELVRRPHSFLHSLRFKLLIASLTLLVIPWIGYLYLLEIEDSLRQSQETLLLSRAEIVANLLNDRLTAEENQTLLASDETISTSLYVHPLEQAPVADGYPEEWGKLITQTRRYLASETSTDAVSFELLAGYHQEYLYLLMLVSDTTLTYPKPGGPLTSGDHLILALPGTVRKSRQYLLGTSAPGWIRVLQTDNLQSETAIRGEWQETSTGYNVELRIPLAMVDRGLSLAVINKDNINDKPIGIAATSGWQTNANLARLVMPSLPSEMLLKGLDSDSHRYTILNRQRQVIGRYGNLPPPEPSQTTFTSRILAALLVERPVSNEYKREHAGHMDGPEIRRALSGGGKVHRYRTRRSQSAILSAAYPLYNADKISGAILVEQSTHTILFMQQTALERLLTSTLLLFLITGGTLFLLASYLTRRITRLSRKFSRTVSQDGRIIGPVSSTTNNDELGELEQSFSSVLQRLQDYNSYLEAMASRLAHEFRTPLAMVQSSLENLQTDDEKAAQKRYTERALEGTHRLQLILNRLREATRLEQALQGAELKTVNMTELCPSLCEGYRLSHPSIQFRCEFIDTQLQAFVAPELISQAMDKLVGNAVDFHTPSTPIHIMLTQQDEKLFIHITNQGPPLPEGMHDVLFQSMVSIRKLKDTEPHLGLGLYLVRLIAEFHNGQVMARNTEDGVDFSLALPIASSAVSD
ncbi:MAG: histidine kinase [Candidatus Thiodiazotropha sp. (ex Notomyrtea botanica)]|nr:histidine kinase [Candidatus Thiodiazotropha sp. (ex Notomyrtea botanica)]